MVLKGILKFFIIFLFIPSVFASTSRDLYVFFISGDGNYEAHLCPEWRNDCGYSELVKKDASGVYFNKATQLAKTCSNCDALIMYIKPVKSTERTRHPKTGELEPPRILGRERVYIYRDGELKKQKRLFRLNSQILIPLPIINLLNWKAREKSFKKPISLFKKALGSPRYRHQFAFFFGHKINDKKVQPGYFKSSPGTDFSLHSFLKGMNDLSLEINGRNRPYDALFLAQCLSTIETIYQVYKDNAARFVLASPNVVPLAGLVGWDLNSLKDHLNQTHQTIKESLQEWLEKIFDPRAQENISELIKVSYALTLYDLGFLRGIEPEFSAAVQTVERLRKKAKESGKKNGVSAERVAKRKSKNKQRITLPNVDCQKVPEVEGFLDAASQGIVSLSKRSELLELIGVQDSSLPHSGWSCLISPP